MEEILFKMLHGGEPSMSENTLAWKIELYRQRKEITKSLENDLRGVDEVYDKQ